MSIGPVAPFAGSARSTSLGGPPDVSLGGRPEAARSEVSIELPPTYRTYSVY